MKRKEGSGEKERCDILEIRCKDSQHSDSFSLNFVLTKFLTEQFQMVAIGFLLFCNILIHN